MARRGEIIFDSEFGRLDSRGSRLARFAPERDKAAGSAETIVEALLGQRLVIPCANMTNEPGVPTSGGARKRPGSSSRASEKMHTSLSNGQGISLLVWYKDDQMESPIFSADARKSGSLREAKQQTNAEELVGRARLEESTRLLDRKSGLGSAPALVIESAEETDAGVYRCAVEFHKAATQTFQLRVILSKPPRNMIISDDSSPSQRLSASGILGPYDEESRVKLTCELEFEGEPPATIAWYQLKGVSGHPPGPFGVRPAPVIGSEEEAGSEGGQRRAEPDHSSPLKNSLLSMTLEEAGAAASAGSHEEIARDYFVAFQALTSGQAQPALPFGNDGAYRLKHWIKAPEQTVIPISSQFGSGKLKASLQVSLTRSNLADEFLCLATNRENSVPLNLTAKINLNLRPTGVRITNKLNETNFVLGQKQIVECQVFGSKPSPRIRWFKGSQELTSGEGLEIPITSAEDNSESSADNQRDYSVTARNNNHIISELNRDINSTKISYLTLTPQLSDNKESLTCSAQNPKMAHTAAISDSMIMNVQFPPQMSLKLGRGLDSEAIRLEQDVFMECHQDANPPIEELLWLFNDKPLLHSPTSGVIMSNQTLVLQRIKLESRGQYQCLGRNSLGQGQSNKLGLRPKFPPVCDYANTKTKYELSVKQAARIECNVLAEPSNDLQFAWKFKQNFDDFQADSISDSPQQSSFGIHLRDLKQFETNFTRSYVSFTPETKREFGQLLCFASNSFGKQEKPCVINIIPSELPDPVFMCFFDNLTNTSFSVHCQAPASSSSSSISKGHSYLLELYSAAASSPPSGQLRGGSQAGSSRQRQQQQRENSEQPDYETEELEHQKMADSRADSQKGAGKSAAAGELRTLTSDNPSFLVTDLEPDTSYHLMIYVQNAKGRSQPASYQQSTLPLLEPTASQAAAGGRIELAKSRSAAEDHLSPSERLISYLRAAGSETSKPSMLAIALGVVLISMFVFMLIYWISCMRELGRRRRPQAELETSRSAPAKFSNPTSSSKQANEPHGDANALGSLLRQSASTNSEPQKPVRGQEADEHVAGSYSSRTKQAEKSRPAKGGDTLSVNSARNCKQASPAIQLTNAGLQRRALRGSRLPAGSGSDTSHETNTDSTLISSAAQANLPAAATDNRQLRFLGQQQQVGQTLLQEIDTFSGSAGSGTSSGLGGCKNLAGYSQPSVQCQQLNSSQMFQSPSLVFSSTSSTNSGSDARFTNTGIVYSTLRCSSGLDSPDNTNNPYQMAGHLEALASTAPASLHKPQLHQIQTGSDSATNQLLSDAYLQRIHNNGQIFLQADCQAGEASASGEPVYVISENCALPAEVAGRCSSTLNRGGQQPLRLLEAANLWQCGDFIRNDRQSSRGAGSPRKRVSLAASGQLPALGEFLQHQQSQSCQLASSSSIPVALSECLYMGNQRGEPPDLSSSLSRGAHAGNFCQLSGSYLALASTAADEQSSFLGLACCERQQQVALGGGGDGYGNFDQAPNDNHEKQLQIPLNHAISPPADFSNSTDKDHYYQSSLNR